MLISVCLLVLALEGGLLPWLMGSEAFSDAQVLHVSPVHCPDTSVLVLPALLGTSPQPRGTIPFVRALAHQDQSQPRSEFGSCHPPWATCLESSSSIPAIVSEGLFKKLCLPTCFAVACEQGQPTRVPWEVIPGPTSFAPCS